MPDILIRDVDIPTRSDLVIHIYPDGKATLYPFIDKPRKVSVVELPPHGDLIDRSEVLFDAGDVCEGCGDYAVFGYSRDQINAYKVIVPASEEAKT